MKRNIRHIYTAVCLSALAIGATSCLEEAFPENGTQTADQIKHADKAALANAIPAYFNTYSSDYDYDAGIPSFGVWRDAMTADLPIYNTEYDFFNWFNEQLYLGNYEMQQLFWRRYYYLLQKCNSTISVCDEDPESPDAPYMGMALTYRAWTYMDLMRTYEYRSTGVERLDQYAETYGLYGITVPLVTEKTTEQESRDLPRAPFTQMYRFIMNDLNRAERLLEHTQTVVYKNMVARGVVYGMKARLWLEMGSRFLNHQADLTLQLAAEDAQEYADLEKLDIASANDCFAKAAEYARKAISEGTYTPTTESQWYDPTNGFNTPIPSWMLCVIINTNNGLAKTRTWQTMPSFLSPEPTYGLAYYTYEAYRMIDARLYSQMDKNDWRRDTWIDPSEVADKEAFDSKYSKATSMSYDDWAKYGAYTGFKFHPAQGVVSISTTGNAVSIPLMRIEEMYLIEAEALAHSQGPGAGKAALESFMNTYRMKPGTTYTVRNSTLDGVVDAVFCQKRIELWGEGLILWDYSRLEKAIERGYPGTNHPQKYRYNSYPEKVAPWTIYYIPSDVHDLNPACKLNPDPSNAITDLWKE